ncbi:PREDICTED: adhesive plaque matrix protein-like [Wasmannia auropunctata]|uniref:adhesive plaque matrix protein-like n=1 Tax=Wasmannia auropunctata TaxID=64793 RepID=UPI0005EEE0FB|nr:PREDICTED: adhesive plaque matrix protein-like [Wasmannia auropunctata]
MERLILLCLLSPAIFARPHKTKNPNDEPFLPIHPVYPYSPKLIKRGAETDAVNSQLMTELYAPKVDAKDTYSTSYPSTYQRDSYYPDYDPYLTNGTASSYVYPAVPAYYGGGGGGGGEAYVYANVPAYPAYNSYPAAYAMNPASYPVPSYPNYYYQPPPYYYPHYFSHALYARPPLPPPPPPSPPQPSLAIEYHEASQVPAVAEDGKQNADNVGERPKEDETSLQEAPAAGQFVEGGNYIAANSRDLDVQSSTYKVASPYNQLTQDVQVKNAQPISLPKPTYRVVSVNGQSVSPDFPLSAAYVKSQQIEQMTSQTLADLLARQQQHDGSSYESGKDTASGADGGASYENQNAYSSNAPASYVSVPGAKGKPGVTYVIDSVGVAKVSGERAKQQSSPSQRAASSKSTRYSNARKQALRNHAQASYASPEGGNTATAVTASSYRARVLTSAQPAGQADKYAGYDASQSYGGTYSQSGSKQEPNYGAYQSQPGSYQSEGFTIVPQTTRSHVYQYSAYAEADQAQQQQQPQQPQQDAANLNNGNFGSKQYKG